MMDKKAQEKIAKKYSKKASCYIHVEMENGKAEQVVAGDGQALIHCLAGIIDRVARLFNEDFSDTMKAITAWHDIDPDIWSKRHFENWRDNGRYKK